MLRIGPNATSDENSAINIIQDTQRVGIQKDPTGEYILDVSGAINCDAIFVGGTQFTGSSGSGGVWTEHASSNISYGDGDVFITGGNLDVSGTINCTDLLVNGAAFQTTSSSIYEHTSQSLSSPNDLMNKITNLVVSPFHSEGDETSNQGQYYFPDIYNIDHSKTFGSVNSVGIIDTDVFSFVAPSYTTYNTSNDDKTTGSDARFGIKILQSGLYRYRYSGNIENESYNNRMASRTAISILHDDNGTETFSILEQSIAMEYMRHQSYGQWCNVNNFGYFEITSAMASHDNGVFLKLVVSVINASGETFSQNANNIKFSYGCLEIEKIAELAS